MAQKKRSLFPIITTYQSRLVFSVFIPALILHLCIFGMLTILHLNLATLILKDAPTEVVARFVDSWSATVILISLCFVSTLVIIIFVVSRGVVGAFERIIEEIDQVIEGKRDAPLSARTHDSLANALLQRINILLEKRNE